MDDLVIEEHVSLASHTTLKVGGTARYFMVAKTEQAVAEAVTFAEERHLPLFVLGAGSNVLALDNEYPGVVVKIAITGIDSVVMSDTHAVVCTVGAGEDLDTLISHTVQAGWWGIENLTAIPSSVGAVPVQNVGAYGVEASQVVTMVRVYNRLSHSIDMLTHDECRFAYRDSIFKHPEGKHYIVLAVIFTLTTSAKPQLTYKDLAERFLDQSPTLQEIRAAVVEIRADKFPDWKVVGTAGSFFKNPIVANDIALKLAETYPTLPIYEGGNERTKKISLGFILDKVCGLKGYRDGAVGLFEKQALVLTVTPYTTADAVVTFAHLIAEKVFVTTGIVIEWEVVVLQ